MAEPNDLTRDVPPLELRAAFRPGSVNAEKRTADVVWSTGAPVLRGFFDKFYEELSLNPECVRLERLNNSAPLLNAHDGFDARSVVGVVEPGTAKVDGKQGTATVRFAKAEDDPEADAIFRKVCDGILANISVGYRVHMMEKQKGGEAEIPTFRATDWEPYEISVVPMGADDGAGFRGADRTPNPCVFTQRQETRAMPDPIIPAPAVEPEKRTAVEQAVAAAKVARAAEAEALAASATRAAEEARTAERGRQLEIRSIVRRAKLSDDLADQLIGSGATVEEVRKVAFEQLATEDDALPTAQHVRIGAGEDKREKFVRGASAWLFERSGIAEVIEQATKKDPKRFKDVSLDGAEFRGLSLVELARESLERNGVRTRGLSRMDMIGLSFTRGGTGYQTTSDFAVLLENVLYKSLLGAYAVTPDTWSRFCKTDTVADFRPSNRYRTGSLSVLDSVNEHGEFQNKVIPDGQKTSISVATKGNIIALSRQTIINDDMGALTDVSTKLGRASALSIETDVYALLAQNSGLGPTQTDSAAFFHTNRANVNATASAITVAGVNADSAIMAAQKDISSNEYLDLRPAVMLVPWALFGDASTINDAQYDPADSKFQKPNYCRGMFREIVRTPRLTGTRRYLFAEPSVAPAIVVAFLEGQGQAPVLESEKGWRVDGVEWKVRLDYKAQMFDPKGAVTNAGA